MSVSTESTTRDCSRKGTLDLTAVRRLEQGLISLLALERMETESPQEPLELPVDLEEGITADVLRRELIARCGDDLRTVYGLARRLELDRFERDALLVAYAPELDPRNRMVFAKVSALMSPDGRPTVGLVAHILGADHEDRLAIRRALRREGRLRSLRILEVADNQSWNEAEALVRLAPEILDLILHGELPAGRPVRGIAEEAPDDVPMILDPFHRRTLLVTGEHLLDRRATAAALAARQSLPILHRTIPGADTRESEAAAVHTLVRDSILHQAVALAELDEIDPRHLPEVLRRIHSLPGRLVISMPCDVSGSIAESAGAMYVCEARRAHYGFIRSRWEHGLQRASVPPDVVDLDRMASRYRLDPWAIDTAIARAVSNGDLTQDGLMAQARSLACRSTVTHARRVRPSYTLDDMVLPDRVRDHLKHLITFAENRERAMYEHSLDAKLRMSPGLVALFTGESGTGKTMAAEVLANALDRDLYIVDLASLVSKWVGETEKHIDQVLREAEEAHCVLLFDEADALFGSRTEDVKSSNDRYANLEVGYLLQRIEAFRGVAVLTSNLDQNIDKAFSRRFSIRIDFPLPSSESRTALMSMLIPDVGTFSNLDSLLGNSPMSLAQIKKGIEKSLCLADRHVKIVKKEAAIAGFRFEFFESGRLVRSGEARSGRRGG